MMFKIVPNLFLKTLTVVLVVCTGSLIANSQQVAQSQPSNQAQAQQSIETQPPIVQPADVGTSQNLTGGAMLPIIKKIGYRLPAWKTIHAHGAAAQEQSATLERLGCEVKQNSHGDHTDLNYRCPQWKSLTLQTDEQVQQWKTWLDGNGFESLSINPPVESPLPKVKFRLADWKTMHLHQAEQLLSFTTTFKMLGCEVETANHGDHIDAKIRCQQWMTIELPTEETAHNWQGWLNQSGFETQHEHVHAHAHGQDQPPTSVGQQVDQTQSGSIKR